MTRTRRHLMKSRDQAACGLRNPAQRTKDPAQVTCLTCAGSLFMAEEELRLTNPGQPKRRRKSRQEGERQ